MKLFNTHFAIIRTLDLACLWIALLFFSCMTPAIAQPVSAGSILQQINSESPVIVLPPVMPEAKGGYKEAPESAVAGGQKFIIKRFEFSGNVKISTEKLQVVVAEFLNRSYTFSELKNITDVVAGYYRDEGWLARVILPPQDITSGTVTIQIIEANLGNIIIENKTTRITNHRIEAWIYSRIPRGTALSLSELDRAILTLSDLPDVNVVSSIQEGKAQGETNIRVVVTNKNMVDGSIGVDNFGQNSTGQNRGTANLNINGALGFGEQISLSGLYTEGTNYGRVSVVAPVGSSGLKMGINASTLSYRVSNSSLNPLWVNGSSNTAGAELSYPIIRSRPTNLYFITNYNYSSFDNRNITGIQNQYNTSVLVSGLTGNAIDSFSGGGINQASLLLSGGNVSPSSAISPLSPNSTGPEVNGNFSKLRYGANRLQSVTSSLSAYLGISGQVASKNMDPSEQLYVGGPYSVRAYATGQGSASQGNVTTFELRQSLPWQTTLTGFYDYGNVQTYKNNVFGSGALNNNYVLQGFGTSLGWVGPGGFQLKATWAMRTGSIPSSVYQYLSASGGMSSNRVWLSALLPL